jgi:TRAP-type C4-dicarboxylate transport system permease small subunit
LVDSLFEYLSLGFLLVMIVIVCWQVFSRYALSTSPYWSEEVTLILMVWVGFLGTAIGFREKLHIGLEFLFVRFPQVAQRWLARAIYALSFLFGLYLVIQGWLFTVLTSNSTLAATQLPSSVVYAVMPVSGLMICFYTALQLFGIRTEKHGEDVEEDEAGLPTEQHID